ncbi:MAG: hypothetical protein WBF53_01595, partial [Litorimonas sp.]
MILVVGSHRSGTSVLAQIVATLGADIGRSLMPPSYDNPRGFWENSRIVAVHETLIGSFGLDWTRSYDLPEGWLDGDAAAEALRELDAVLDDDFSGDAPLLVKDPRLCVLGPLWERLAEHRGVPLRKVLIVRDPDASAASLARRNGIDAPAGRYLSLSHIGAATAQDWPDGATAFTYEYLLQASGSDTAEAVVAALPELAPNLSDPVRTQIDRLVERGRKTVGKATDVEDEPASPYASLLREAGLRPGIEAVGDWARTELATKPMKAVAKADAASFLPEGGGRVDMPLAELEEMKAELAEARERLDAQDAAAAALADAEEARTKELLELQGQLDAQSAEAELQRQRRAELEAEMERLSMERAALEEAAETAKRSERALSGELQAATDRANSLQGGVEERDASLR